MTTLAVLRVGSIVAPPVAFDSVRRRVSLPSPLASSNSGTVMILLEPSPLAQARVPETPW
jgi:hypothetical protein